MNKIIIFILCVVFIFCSCFEQPEYPQDKSSVSALVYGNGKFIAGFGWAKMSISEDGINWVSVNNPFISNTTDTICYGNDIYVAGSVSGLLAYSYDGKIWNLIDNSPFGTSNIYSICYANDIFIAVGENGKIANSADGISWNIISNSIFDYYDEICTVVYGNGKFIIGGNRFNHGRFLSSTIAYSIDGNIWQSINQSNNNNIFSSAFGANIFIIGYGKGQIKYSSDGLNWENSNVSCFGENETIRSITFGESKYLAVGGGGIIAYSNDGINWYKKNHNIRTHGFLNTVYGEGLFLVGDWDGNITVFYAYDF